MQARVKMTGYNDHELASGKFMRRATGSPLITGQSFNMLAFDMGVLGPYGARRERAFVHTAYKPNQDGVMDDWS